MNKLLMGFLLLFTFSTYGAEQIITYSLDQIESALETGVTLPEKITRDETYKEDLQKLLLEARDVNSCRQVTKVQGNLYKFLEILPYGKKYESLRSIGNALFTNLSAKFSEIRVNNFGVCK